MRRLILLLLVPALVAGCMTTAQINDKMTTGTIDVRGLDDDLEHTVTIFSGKYDYNHLTNNTEVNPALFTAIHKEKGLYIHSIWVDTRSNEWESWNEIRLRVNGELESYPAERIDGDVNCESYGCVHRETFSAIIPERVVEALATDTTMVVRLSGAGHRDFTLAPGEAEAHLKATREAVNTVRAVEADSIQQLNAI